MRWTVRIKISNTDNAYSEFCCIFPICEHKIQYRLDSVLYF